MFRTRRSSIFDKQTLILAAAALAAGSCTGRAFASPWAAEVVSYDLKQGLAAYSDPATVLGSPSRFTGSGEYAGAVTPFNPPYNTDQIVSVGAGGHLTVRFAQPITDDPSHLYGVDLLLFSNSWFYDGNWPTGIAAGVVPNGIFNVSVSQNGSDFVALPGGHSDGMFPTLAYLDLTGPYDPLPGSAPADYLKPVNPALRPADFLGKTFAEIVAMYDGSGGGIPLDIHSTGLSAVNYVRIDIPADGARAEFDAFAVVPEPTTAGLFIIGGLVAALLGRGAREE